MTSAASPTDFVPLDPASSLGRLVRASNTADPGQRDLRVVVIGAGMAGMLAAITLQAAGYRDVGIYEKADRVGGTWRENTYPGIACDVPSHLYSYSFALNPGWSHAFSPGPEIQRYFERVAEAYQLDRLIEFNQEVTSCEWIDGRWQLQTSSGRRDHADVVIAATGVLHHPKYPSIEGIEQFDGPVFHSSRWDHGVPIDGRRLALVGTGSSAVQIVPAVADRVAELTIFQRTAQWIMPSTNPAYGDDELQRFRQDPDEVRELHRQLADVFDVFSNSVVDAASPQMASIEAACRENLEQAVTDPELRDLLRPEYRPACKRLVISPEFYRAVQNPHVQVVTEHIERVEPKGVRTSDGALHELDVLVLATGFQVDAFMRPMSVTGRGGRTLEKAWVHRPEAYLSISIPDFPNLFMLNGPNGPVGNFSLIGVAELQMSYILGLMEEVRTGRCREISATQQALDEFEAARLEASKSTIWSTGCRSWYLDDRGVPAVWPWSFATFRQRMSAPELPDYDLRN